MSTEPASAARFCPICETYLDALVCPTDQVSTIRADLERARTKDRDLGRVVGGRYRVERLLGEGASGRVYAATQLSIGREVALKLLQPRHDHDRHHLRRFYREARAATRLTSQHVVQVYDFGVDDDTGAPYIAMELLRGETLSAWLAEHGPVTPVVAARLLAPVARALIDASGAGIVHRDLKPSNIIVMTTGDGSELVKVTDFGIAKELGGDGDDTETLTAHGAAIGTPAYMAPEQATGGDVDHRADLYALGCVLYEALSGRPPFGAEARAKLLADHLLAAAPPLPDPLPAGGSASAALSRLVADLLAKAPRDRPADARVVVQILDAIARGEARPAAPPTTPPTAPRETIEALRLPVPMSARPSAPGPARETPPSAPAPLAPPPTLLTWPARLLAKVEQLVALPPSADPAQPAQPGQKLPENRGVWPFSRRRLSPEERLIETSKSKRRRWLRHVRRFIAVNVGLLFINVVTAIGDGDFELWFAYVLAAWSIPFTLHGLGYKAWREENAEALASASAALGLPKPAAAPASAAAPSALPAPDPVWAALIERCRQGVALAERDLADVPPDPHATVDPGTALRDGLADIERLALGAQRLQRALGEVSPGRAEIRARIAAAELEASGVSEPRLRKMVDGNLELLRAREHRLDQLESELMRMRVTVEGFALAAENLHLDAARLGAPRLSDLANGLAGPLRRLDQEVDVLNEVEAVLDEL